ncbi:hypothetical protein, partial [Tsukamurella paurometabola]
MKKFMTLVAVVATVTGCDPGSGTRAPSYSVPPEPGPDCDAAEVRDLDPVAPVACVLLSPSFPGLRFEYSDTAAVRGYEGREQRIVVRDGAR